MIENLPTYIAIIFGLTTIATLSLFHFTMKKSSYSNQALKISVGLLVWLVIHGVLSFTLFYKDTIGDIPPKLPFFGVVPIIVTILYLFNSKNGKAFIDSLPLKQLTIISIVRIPVEFVLYWLFLNNAVPELMTFTGRNQDIFAGLTAPLIAYFAFRNDTINKKLLLIWNIAGTVLLLNIVVNALLSFPTIIQQQAFDMPNIGLLYFPFVWLPIFVAPLVLLTHFISISQLLKK